MDETLNPAGTDKKPETETLGNISERLGEQAQTEKKVETDQPKAVEPIQFDVEKLSPEQMQALKVRLGVTPDRAVQKKGNAQTFLRKIGGRFVIGIGKAYLALVYDANRLAEVETHKIPVKFHDADKFTDIIYADFMNAERVGCDILSIRQEKNTRVEGEVIQRETGKLVEMEVNVVSYFFTVLLPTGEKVEIEGSASNA